MLRLICLIGLLRFTLANTEILNEFVDRTIVEYNKAIKRLGRARMPVKDLFVEFPYKKHSIKVTGKIHCSDGYAEDLSTFRRTGEIAWFTEGNGTAGRIPISLSNLHSHYGHCEYRVMNALQFIQSVDIFVSPFSIEAQVLVKSNGNHCASKLDYFKVSELGIVTIETGGSVFHRVGDRWLEWMARKFRKEIVGEICKELELEAAVAFKKSEF